MDDAGGGRRGTRAVVSPELWEVLAARWAMYYADTEFGLAASQDRIAALQPLVRAYASGLDNPLTGAEQAALPWAIARRPLWGIGGWAALLDHQDTARAHARATFPAIRRALQLVPGIGSWHAGLSS